MQPFPRVVSLCALIACTRGGAPPAPSASTGVEHVHPVEASTLRTHESGVQIHDISVGKGPAAVEGQLVTIAYSGWLTDGTMFDSSVENGRPPIEFVLGAPGIIKGWTPGITGMKLGGRRHLIVPPELAYGRSGRPPAIPDSATLIFDVELVELGSLRQRPDQPDLSFDTDPRTRSIASGVRAIDLVVGTGLTAQERSPVEVEVTIWTESGEAFFSTYDTPESLSRMVGGEAHVRSPVPGIDMGMMGMAAGGQRYLELTAEAAFTELRGPRPYPQGTVYALIDMTAASAPRIPQTAPSPYDPRAMTTTQSGLQTLDLAVGTGRLAAPSDVLSVEYTGWLLDGTRFDSTYDRAGPFRFEFGQGRVIQAWEEGLEGMQVGGRRLLIAPPELAYGERGNRRIPGNSTLVFEVELVGITPPE